MSRYLPDPSIPVSPWDPEVLEAVRASNSPLYVVAYTNPEGGAQVSVLQGNEADVLDGFHCTNPKTIDRQLQARGYVALASVLAEEWKPLPAGGRGSALFRSAREEDDFDF